MSIGKEIIESLSEFNKALADGTVGEQFTCRQIRLQLDPVTCNADDVKRARHTLRLNQPLFAQFLGVDVNTVQKWEQGVQTPAVIACRFIQEILTNPEFFTKRISDLAAPAG